MALGYGYYSAHPGEFVYDALEGRGISQKDFAEAIGMSPTVLNEILRGRRTRLRRLCS